MSKIHGHIIAGIILLFFFSACGTKGKRKYANSSDEVSKQEQITASDTLRIATSYGATSYFFLRDKYMGFDYEMARNLAEHLGVNLKVYVTKSIEEMLRLLENNEIDLVACKTVKTKALVQNFEFVYPQSESYQILLKKIGKNEISNVTQLAGKTVHVTENSIFHQRLLALNDEIGGTIQIEVVPDTVTNADLIKMLIQDSIQYTLAYYDVAMLYKSYFPVLDCRLQVGFAQKNGWLIQKGTDFAETIETWASLPKTKQLETRLRARYWDKNPCLSNAAMKIPGGYVSPYDDVFKEQAMKIGWDWRLLAALAFAESGFDATEISIVGAVGIMQLMPSTAIGLGLDEITFFNPEENIKAGTAYIKQLDKVFKPVKNPEERHKFILASYNSGPAHILDAMALTEKYGKNPHIWSENVEYFLLKKNEPEFYQDTLVRYGSFKGVETVGHVKKVLEAYERFLKK